MPEHVTLLQPKGRQSRSRRTPSSLPADLVSQSAARLRVLALLYAVVFFLAGVLPPLVLPEERARFLSAFLQWGPHAIGIFTGLLVAAIIRSHRIALRSARALGLVFEVASSYAIAAAEFGDPQQLEMHQGYLGLSW